MNTITELNPRLPALIAIRDVQLPADVLSDVHQSANGRDLETLRAHGLAAERVMVAGDPADAVRSPTAGITQILQEG